MESPSKPVESLEYARASKAHGRLMRRGGLFVGIVVALSLIFTWIPATWRYIEISYWAHRCLDYTPPPHHLIFDFDLANQHPIYLEINPAQRHFDGLFDRFTVATPSAFLHQLKRPDGLPRLVECTVNASQSSGLYLEIKTWAPQTSIAGWTDANYQYSFYRLSKGTCRLKVFEGAADPSNPCHFTIPLDLDGRSSIIDGWLKNDDKIFLGPAQDPSVMFSRITTAPPPASPGKSLPRQ
jgi:hypothetical protein